jgi:hypothetical protein
MQNYATNTYKKTFSDLPEVNYAIEPDWELVINILKKRRHSYSKEQDIFVDELQDFFNKQGATTSRDAYGSLYVVKGQSDLYRCMVAHTDINQTRRNNVRVYMSKEWIFGFDMEEGCQCGLGADDGIGISLAIEMFNRFDAIKLFFPKDEEVGCVGSNQCDVSFFSDCSMILQGDRRSFSNDLITFTNGIETCSQEFVDAASEISLKYGYAAARGICTDVGSIKKNAEVDCIACNISIGYAFEHTDKEVISKAHYRNAVNYVYDLLVGMGEVKWEHVYTIPVYKAPSPTSPRQGNLFEQDYAYGYEDYYTGRYGKDFWEVPDCKDPFKEAAKATEEAEEEYEMTEVDRWVFDKYPQYNLPENRIKFKHIKCNDVYITSPLPDQDIIDDMIDKGTCPCCLNPIFADNILNITTVCNDCFSVFNIPEEEYDFYNGSDDSITPRGIA